MALCETVQQDPIHGLALRAVVLVRHRPVLDAKWRFQRAVYALLGVFYLATIYIKSC